LVSMARYSNSYSTQSCAFGNFTKNMEEIGIYRTDVHLPSIQGMLTRFGSIGT
jgi:hypothetical protein